MKRIRLSTTVDATRLEACRRRLAVTDSKLVDRALIALLDELERDAEWIALDAHPYEDDPDLTWDGPPGLAPSYHGDIPAAVVELAARRRRRT